MNSKRLSSGALTTALEIDEPLLLASAARIGRGLVRDATWDCDRCNWDTEAWDVDEVEGASAYSWIPGPTLYSGSPGIGLFLAQLHVQCNEADSWYIRTARGAFKHAASVLRRPMMAETPGFYEGLAGAAFAFLQAGRRANVDEWIHEGAELASRLARSPVMSENCDIIGGLAGTVIGLVLAHELIGGGGFLDAAERQARQILRLADSTAVGCSWRPATGARARRNLTGMSHGASGVAWALAEMYRLTGDGEFRATCLGGVEYERSVMDRQLGNWPDFRQGANSGSPVDEQPKCLRTWCHGAPGIAVARLRIGTIMDDLECMEEAMTALQTTRSALLTPGVIGTDYGICHGAFGLMECLLNGRATLKTREFDDEMGVLVRDALAAFGVKDNPWRCGSRNGAVNRGLMSGVAGIGYSLLRLATPSAAPSVIMPFEPIGGTRSAIGLDLG